MGVDPGLTRCGLSVIESGQGRKVTALDVHFHTPSEVKAAVTGNGRADKAQVTAMVTRILALQTKPTPADAADALALAICHCWRAPMIARMAAAEAMAAEQRRTYQAKLKAAR